MIKVFQYPEPLNHAADVEAFQAYLNQHEAWGREIVTIFRERGRYVVVTRELHATQQRDVREGQTGVAVPL